MNKILLFMALVLCGAIVHAAESELPGTLIDDLMKKNGAEVVKTAESALPTPKDEKSEGAKKEVSKNSEATQPVFNNPASLNSTKSPEKSIWGRMLLSLAITLSVFGGLAFAYKKWPGAKKTIGRAKMIEVLNQHHLGPKKSIAVIRVAGEAVLIGVTDNSITLLKNLSLLDDDVPQETKEATFALKNDEAYKFEKTLGAKTQAPIREDEFSMQGLKAIIGDRLKNMKEIR
jgi:flagellar protein FliO/FliZ